MKKETFIVANWKMNLDFHSSKKFITNLLLRLNDINFNSKIIICPQFLLISQINDLLNTLNPFENLFLGAQDCCYEVKGSFTGESSINILKDLNCKYVISGHSERRLKSLDSNEIINKKISLISNFSLMPILCIGESIIERKGDNFKEALSKQLMTNLSESINEIIIAYEPIWSIGSGLIPEMKQIEEVAFFIKEFLTNYKPSIKKINILYGGSVNSENSKQILNLNSINGLLVGGASLDVLEFTKIIKNV